MRNLVVVLAVACSLLTAPLFAGSPQDPRQARTLGQLLAACHIESPPPEGMSLSREIMDFSYEDSGDIFWVAFSWKDESPRRYDMNVLSFEKATRAWRYARPYAYAAQYEADDPRHAVAFGSVVHLAHTRNYLYIDTHINPSAGRVAVLNRDLSPRTLLDGWFLFALSNESVVYQRSRPHVAPTHETVIELFEPATLCASPTDCTPMTYCYCPRIIYPVPPYDPPRLAFIEKMKRAYAEAGPDWCREHNHHCDPRRFTSNWKNVWSVDDASGTAAFLIEFGDTVSRDTPDSKVSPERVVVLCSDVMSHDRMACHEREWQPLVAANPGKTDQELVSIAARSGR